MTSLEHVEWGASLLEPRRERELERALRREMGAVPTMVHYFAACSWLARAIVELSPFQIQLVEIDFALADLIGLVVSQDNSCRYCFADRKSTRLNSSHLGIS